MDHDSFFSFHFFYFTISGREEGRNVGTFRGPPGRRSSRVHTVFPESPEAEKRTVAYATVLQISMVPGTGIEPVRRSLSEGF
jgi:hypothetical protein